MHPRGEVREASVPGTGARRWPMVLALPSAVACVCYFLLPSVACVRVFCSFKLGGECVSGGVNRDAIKL